LKQSASTGTGSCGGSGNDQKRLPYKAIPAKIAALETARSANADIGPAKFADALDGNEPKENSVVFLKGSV
jgi:hypothetical protein